VNLGHILQVEIYLIGLIPSKKIDLREIFSTPEKEKNVF